MSEEEKGFVIKDRRHFTDQGSGEDLQDAATETTGNGEKVEAEDADAAAHGQSAAPEQESDDDTQLPKLNFATFVMSLNSSVLVHLGVLEDPASGAKAKNLAMAKQTIDLLGILEDKTRGNLTPEEESILKNILYDLRMLYVKEKA